MNSFTIQPYKIDDRGNESDILAHVNTVTMNLELAIEKAKAIRLDLPADGVRIMKGYTLVWRWDDTQ